MSALDVAKVAVTESELKRRKRDEKLLAEHEAALKQQEQQKQKAEQELIARTEQYEKEYAEQKAMVLSKRKEAAENSGFYKPADPKIMLIVRIKGIHKIAPKPRKVLQLFRLLQLHNAVLIKVNKATLNMVKLIEPFVTYGYPSVETIRKLIYKRGYLRVGNPGSLQRIKIVDNEIVSQILGEKGIHGVEDMIHELYTCGPNFREVNWRLWTFKLGCPKKGFINKQHGFTEFRKGDWGNREYFINDLIRKML